jgi:hypothetical protein
MKKSIFGLAALALLAVGCAENRTVDENTIVDPNAIGFELGTGKVTRATSMTTTLLQNDTNGFGVFAFTGSGSEEDPFVDYITNGVYVYNQVSAEWQWKGNDEVWPTEDYPIHFAAYYPESATTLTLDDNSPSYTIAGVANQVDYLAAQKLNVNTRPANSKVTLNFQHILSRIDFTVTPGAGVNVPVQSIAVKQVANTAEYNYADMDWESLVETYTNDYQYMATKKPARLPDAVAGDNGSMMLMPQNLTEVAWPRVDDGPAPDDGESYIEAIYRVYESDSDGGDVIGYSIANNHPYYDAERDAHLNGEPLFVKVGYPLATPWEDGKAYTYVLHLGNPNYIGGYLIDENFYDEDGIRTDLPVNYPGAPEPEPGDPDYPDPDPDVPDPVYPDPTDPENWVIGFDVIVTDWDVTTPAINL